jgi:glycosyltransferase involved in cell wall biosynthesis
VVSIVLPTFDRLRLLKSAIDSVLAQTFADWEMIIADDGSAEETRSYLRLIDDPRVRVLWLSHAGSPARGRNAAIAASTGLYLAFLDADDTWAPAKLQRQMEALRARPECRWSYTHCDLIDEEGNHIADAELARQVRPDGWMIAPLLANLRNQMAMASVLAERALVLEAGGFDEQQRWCEDLDLCLRMAIRSPAVALGDPLCSVRDGGGRYSSDRLAEAQYRLKLYEKISAQLPDAPLRALCRRRQADEVLTIAWHQDHRGEHAAARLTLAHGVPLGWRYPGWWIGALKALARPMVPRQLRGRAYGRVRRGA